VNYLYDASLPTSTPSLVLPKSSGYTINKPILPAIPPAAKVPAKYLALSVLGLTPATNLLLSASLTEKLIA